MEAVSQSDPWPSFYVITLRVKGDERAAEKLWIMCARRCRVGTFLKPWVACGSEKHLVLVSHNSLDRFTRRKIRNSKALSIKHDL